LLASDPSRPSITQNDTTLCKCQVQGMNYPLELQHNKKNTQPVDKNIPRYDKKQYLVYTIEMD